MNSGIVVQLDAAVAVVDVGLAVVVKLDTAVAMAKVAITVLVVLETDPDCETMEGSARIAATIAGMSSVVKGRIVTVIEYQLLFGGITIGLSSIFPSPES